MKKIIKLVLALVLIYGCFKLIRKSIKTVAEGLEHELNIYKTNFFIYKEWTQIQKEGKKVTDYLNKNNINSIAIYGAGTFADMLLDEVKDTDIEVKYMLDTYDNKPHKGFEVISPKDINQYPEVDGIIITPVFDYLNIVQELEKHKKDLNIISLENLLL